LLAGTAPASKTPGHPAEVKPLSNRARAVVVAFFAVYLAVGLFAYGDYGVSWDEDTQRSTGKINARFVRGQMADLFGMRSPTDVENRLLTHTDKDYGVFVELPLMAVEHFLGLEDSREVFLARHLCTFLLFWCGLIAFFLMIKDRYSSWRMGLVGCTLLVLTPRIFAHSFYNSKDIGFLALFIMAMYTFRRLWGAPTILNTILHAGISAALITTRIGGVLIPAVTVVAMGLDSIRDRRPRATIRRVKATLGYLGLTGALTVAFWPYLWADPVGNFVRAFQSMSQFRWPGQTLYMGSFLPGSEVPWHYVPVWLGITVPIGHLMLFGVGVASLATTMWQNHLQAWPAAAEEDDLFFLILFSVPIVGAVVLGSVLYDGWRHMYFVYPAFLMIALRGFAWLVSGLRRGSGQGRFRWVAVPLLVALGYHVLATASWMVKNHPHQQVYFNGLAGADVGRRFEQDYWGLSYRQGLEYLLRFDRSSEIQIAVSSKPGRLNRKILRRQDRMRIRYANEREATYYLSNYRGSPFRGHAEEHRRFYADEPPYTQPLWSLKVDGKIIMGLYRLAATSEEFTPRE
jgi:hypothetical protein